jgi:adenosylhomocysteinase
MIAGDILEALGQYYREEEFPALMSQIQEWSKTRPMDGLRVIDATPHFRNTFAKYAALLAAGCDLTIAYSELLSPDPDALAWAEQWQLPCVPTQEAKNLGPFDLVLDCAGELCDVESRLGYVELTRSGVERYRKCTQPVWVVDMGRIKQIETCLGTGDGFMRGMAASGFPIRSGVELMVFGYGKVGRGIVLMAQRAGAKITVVDANPDRAHDLPTGVSFIPLSDLEAVRSALCHMQVAVTATGVLNALQGIIRPQDLAQADCLCANMGVEDEWGPEIPRERLLHMGKTLNFILRDPTRMSYIDPAMALHNAGAIQLIRNDYQAGIISPEPEVEESYLKIICNNGLISEELALLGLKL